MADFLLDHRRPIPKDDAVGLDILFRALVVRRATETQIWPHEGYLYAWWGEYSNYIGWAGVALGAVALFFTPPRFRRERVVVAIATAICAGDHGTYSPYAILRSLPMLQNFRVPTRYWIVANVFFVGLLAWSVRATLRTIAVRLRGQARAFAFAAYLALLAYFAADLVASDGLAMFKHAMPTPPAPPNEGPGELHQVLGSSGAMYLFPPRNLGTLRCFDELTVDISPELKAGLPHEIYLDDPSAGRVEVTHFSPSEWRAHVSLARPAVVVLNQNAFRGWHVDGGKPVAHGGVVAAEVDGGEHDLVFRYRPRGTGIGAMLTFGSIAAAIALVLRERRLNRAAE